MLIMYINSKLNNNKIAPHVISLLSISLNPRYMLPEAELPLGCVRVWVIFCGDFVCIDNFYFKNSLQNAWAQVKYTAVWMKNFKSPSTRKRSNAKTLGRLVLKHHWSSFLCNSLVPFILCWLHHYPMCGTIYPALEGLFQMTLSKVVPVLPW